MRCSWYSILLSCALAASSHYIIGQGVAINSDDSDPDPSAALDVKATDKGILIPRLNSAERTGIASPANGLLVYDSDTQSFWYFAGGSWVDLSGNNPVQISDTDQNTLVQVEESANEDVIRFDLAGQEVLVLDKNDTNAGVLAFPNSNQSVFIGQNAGTTSTGNGNIYIGENAGTANTSGQYNVMIGYESGVSLTGLSNNTFVGSFAGFSATTGTNNTFLGSGAGGATSTGSNNTFVGLSTAQRNNLGGNNTMLGRSAGLFNYHGNNNVYIGMGAGEGAILATEDNAFSNNTYLGYQSGKNATGSDNVFIGHQAGFSETGSDKLYVSNTNTPLPLIYGEFDNGFLQFNGDVNVLGVVTQVSDSSYKSNIKRIPNALHKVSKLSGYQFNWKEPKQTNQLQAGLIAQEVRTVMPELVYQSANNQLSVNYDGLIPYLVESIKTQQAAIEQLNSVVSELQHANREMFRQLEESDK